MKANKGFTLIELVVVIVILGILAAVAMPKFMDLSGTAHDASAQGVAGAIASGSAVNYAKFAAAGGVTGANGPYAVTGADNAAVCTAAKLQPLITGGPVLWDTATALPAGTNANSAFQITAGTGVCAGGGTTVTCKITPSGSSNAQTTTVTCTS